MTDASDRAPKKIHWVLREYDGIHRLREISLRHREVNRRVTERLGDRARQRFLDANAFALQQGWTELEHLHDAFRAADVWSA